MSNNKSEIFTKELNYISNNALRGFIERCLDAAPDYFYEMGASSTGKYHPAYTLGKGGLIRHTKAAVAIAVELMRLEMYAHIKTDWDYIVAALILHDSCKKGYPNESTYTTFDHPLAASRFIIERLNSEQPTDDAFQFMIGKVCGLIDSHMGQWTTDREGKEILPKPKSASQKFVHMCDFLASRKFITITKTDGTPLD